MSTLHRLIAALSLVVLAFGPAAFSAEPPIPTEAQRQAVIEKTIALVDANYVFPDRAKAVAAELRKQSKAGAYKAETWDDFLAHLNRDMQAAGNDKHLKVNHNPRVVAQLKKDYVDDDEVDPQYVRMLEENNFRLKRVETLEGNIGYFKFDNFVELRFVKDAFVGAMNFLHHSSALVIDLTDNGGGASETSDLLLGYFLPDGTKVGEVWRRATNETTVSTVARAPGVNAMPDTPLVILVSERTGSAAEAVAYTLQQAKRAVIIGSRTKGMANAGQLFPLDDQLYVMVPMSRQKNAVSGTNWEGVGVLPDITGTPETTLPAGMVAALNAAAERKADPKEKFRLHFLARPFEAQISPEAPPAGFIDACAGEYEGGQRIAMKDGALHYVKGDVDRRLSYMSDRTFTVEGRTDYRLQFDLSGSQVSGYRVLWFDDTSDAYRKMN
jgi:C-terminal processing protease CtpA/Prc